MKYRADIDGLRAVAILPVVLYHLGLRPISGGYVGVDIFFVISGYLIMGLILPQIDRGTFTIAGFYMRRCRRIFPALFVMCAVFTVLAVAFYLPAEVPPIRDGLVATTVFASNIYFYFIQDYFAPAAETQPLLHTWSLAVEEQFYVAFPLMLFGLRRLGRQRLRIVLMAAALVSLGWSAYLVVKDPSGAFYLPQSRAWELLIGALLASGAIPVPRSSWLPEAIGVAGLLMIATAVVFYTDDTPFPGLTALLPCLGAGLLIYVGETRTSFAGRLLSLPPIRFIGLISYSLYIWHWPIDVFYLHQWGQPGRLEKLAIIAASFALATISWHWVERPFRTQPFRLGTRGTLAVSAAIMASLLVCTLAIEPVASTRWSLSKRASEVQAFLDYHAGYMRSGKCFLDSGFNSLSYFDRATCLKMEPARRNFLIIGDSQAADLWYGLSTVSSDINVLQATSSGCRPLIGGRGEARCTDLMRFVFETFLPVHRVDGIILSGRWTMGDLDALVATAKAVAPQVGEVIVLGPRPEYWHPLPRDLVLGIVWQDPNYAKADLRDLPRELDAILADRLQATPIHYFSLYRAICPDGTCREYVDDGSPLQFDYGHFTAAGSTYVARQIWQSGIMTALDTQ